MGMYALGILPLIKKLGKQVWFVDDAAAAGKLIELREWWNQIGPNYCKSC